MTLAVTRVKPETMSVTSKDIENRLSTKGGDVLFADGSVKKGIEAILMGREFLPRNRIFVRGLNLRPRFLWDDGMPAGSDVRVTVYRPVESKTVPVTLAP